MSRILGGAVGIACVCLHTSASGGVSDVRLLAATCASCHRPGQRVPPPIEGQSRAALIEKLLAFRAGTRDGTVMPQLANGYTREELEALAAYFAARRVAR